MVIKALLFFLFALAFLPACAQTLEKVPDQDRLLTIQQVEITNPSIRSFLEKFIRKASAENELFAKGFGYITLSETRPYHSAPVNVRQKDALDKWQQDTLLTFKIELTSRVLLDEPEADAFLSDYYPAYYSVIEGCPVLIYDEIVNVYFSRPCHFCYKSPFSLSSKRQLQDIINPRLKSVFEPDFRFIDLKGGTFQLDHEERRRLSDKELLKKAAFVLTPTYLVYLLRNGTYLQKML